jgi:hypothetical protein
MSLPEISRRCLSCGAAVRAGARFCPHCGHAFEAGAQAAAEGDAGAARAQEDGAEERPAPGAAQLDEWVAPQTREAEVPRAWAPPTREFSAFEQSLAAVRPGAGAEAGAAEHPAAPGETASAEPEAAEPAESAAEGAGALGARSRVARVREGTRARVERMRDEAIVALEETPDDSGLRFVVAAAALFLVFVFLLVLSTTVLR